MSDDSTIRFSSEIISGLMYTVRGGGVEISGYKLRSDQRGPAKKSSDSTHSPS